jgi:hypothetical protein
MSESMFISNFRLPSPNHAISFASRRPNPNDRKEGGNFDPSPYAQGAQLGDAYQGGMAPSRYRQLTPPDQQRPPIRDEGPAERPSEAKQLETANMGYIEVGQMDNTRRTRYHNDLQRVTEDNLTDPQAARSRVKNHLTILGYPTLARTQITQSLANKPATQVNQVWSILKNKSLEDIDNFIAATRGKSEAVVRTRVGTFLRPHNH